MVDKVKQGKKNKKDGAKFELLVRKDLESKGWIVFKNNNNVQFLDGLSVSAEKGEEIKVKRFHMKGRFIQGKSKYNPFTKTLMMNSGGFPDFIAFKGANPWVDINIIWVENVSKENQWKEKVKAFGIIGVEAKSNGYLDKEEKEKCRWLLENKIFSKILIAYKEKEGKKIVVKYKEFE